MFESKFRIVSIGIAAENKALDSYELPVAPIEIFPLVDGELVESLDETDVSGVDQTDLEYTVRLKTSSTVTATWLQKGSNRVTAPDVRRGERLLLWQYADSDKYYWTSMGMDDEQRRLETVIWAWSATPEIDAQLDLTENMYSLELSTHGKHITLHTTQADGEPFEYTIQLNTKDGLFFITDQDGNSIQLNSAERIIKAINSDESEITIDKTKIYAYAKDEIKARSDDHFEASSGGIMDVKCEATMNIEVAVDVNGTVGGNTTLTVGGNITDTAGGNVSITAGGAVSVVGKGGAISIAPSGAISVGNGAAGIVMNGPNVDIN